MKKSLGRPANEGSDSAHRARCTTEDAAAILSRRDFLIASTLAGCGLAIAGSGCPASAPQKVKDPAFTDDTVYEDGLVEPVEPETSKLGSPTKELPGDYDDLYPVELINRADKSMEEMRTQLAGHLGVYESSTDEGVRECLVPNIDSMRQYLSEGETAYGELRRAAAQNDLDTARQRYGDIVRLREEFSYSSSNADYCNYDQGQICLSEICLQPMICLEYDDPQVCLW